MKLQPSLEPKRRPTARERWALVVLTVFAVGALVFWRPLRHQVLAALALRSEDPAESTLAEVADGTPDPAKALTRIWRKGQPSARLFVLRRLRDATRCEPALARKMDFALNEAFCDVDPEVREAAFKILATQKHPELRRWLREQLSDADPAKKFSTWLYAIAANLARDRQRWQGRHPHVSLDAVIGEDVSDATEILPHESPGPAELADASERAALVRAAVAALPEDLRVPLVLAEYEEMSQADIGAVLECSAKAVEMRIYRARQQLRQSLAKLLPPETPDRLARSTAARG